MRKCRFINCLSLSDLQKGYTGRFARSIKELVPICQNLKSLELDSMSDKLALRVLNIVSQCIEARNCDISSLTIRSSGHGGNTAISWSLLKNLRTLNVRPQPDFAYFKLKRLWIKGSGHVSCDMFSSISPYLHSPFDVNLRHLILNDLRSIPMTCSRRAQSAHPLYWLWNIPTLESAELGVELPPNHSFSTQCQIILGKAEMRSAAREQTSFTSLTLKISNLEGFFDWNSIFIYIRLMYLNLKEISYIILPLKRLYRDLETKVKVTRSIDWKKSFGGLRQIELGIGVSIETANSLLMTMNENDPVFRDLEVISILYSIHPVVDTSLFLTIFQCIT